MSRRTGQAQEISGFRGEAGPSQLPTPGPLHARSPFVCKQPPEAPQPAKGVETGGTQGHPVATGHPRVQLVSMRWGEILCGTCWQRVDFPSVYY